MAGPLAAALALVMAPSALGASPDRSAGRNGRNICDPGPPDVTTTRHARLRGPRVGPGPGHADLRDSLQVRSEQCRLRAREYRREPVDGRVVPRVSLAVTRVEIGHGLTRTRATVAALGARPQHARPTATPSPITASGGDVPQPSPGRASAARTRPDAVLFIVTGLVLGAGTAVIITRSRSTPKPSTSPPTDDARRGLVEMAPPAPPAVDVSRPTRVLGYAIARPGEPRPTRLDISTQAIGGWCERHGRQLDRVVHDVEPRERISADRPGLHYALNQIAEGAAAGLVCAQLGDLSRSLPELGAVLRWFLETDAFLVTLDFGIDTSTASGAAAARMLAQVGQWERERLIEGSQRALAASASRPAVRDDPELSARINEMRARGMSLRAIADTFNAEGVPTKRGGARWRPSSVQAAAGYKRPPARRGRIDLPPLPRDPNTTPTGRTPPLLG